MNVKTLINELLEIELICENLKTRACNARAQLECFHTPAPSGGKRSKLSKAKILELKIGLKKSMLHKRQAV